MNKEEQVQKLAKTIVKSGIATDYEDALRSARSMLKMPEPAEEKKEEYIDPSSLPKLDDIKPAPVSLSTDFDKDKTLKEILEEDSRKIYAREGSKKQQPLH